MADLIAFRPRMGADRLKKIAQKMDYPNVSRFIEDAILEKVQREVHSEKNSNFQQLNEDIEKLIKKHAGLRWNRTGSRSKKEDQKRSEKKPTDQAKSHEGDRSLKRLFEEAKHHRYVRPED